MPGNQNITTGQLLPGVWGFVDYNSQGGGSGANNFCLLWGYVGATAQRTPNQAFLPASQQEADDGCERGSDLANAYAAAIAQPEAQGATVYLLPIVPPSGGVASTYPRKAGTIQLWLASRAVPAVGFTTSDTNATIATALAAAINTMKDSPIGTATVSTDTVTIPYRHNGTTGEDFPIRCNISPNASGVTLSPGQITVATTAVGSGSISTSIGQQVVSTAIAGADTASAIATKIAAAFNADTFPCGAVVDSGINTQVNLLFTNDKDVRRITAAVITTTGTTVNLGSGATDGTGSASSLTYNGTQGTGAPSLTAALANLSNIHTGSGFRSWAAPWLDAATVGALATNLEAASNGTITGQRQQHLTICSPAASSVAGALPTATSPDLTLSAPHYAILWTPDSSVQGMAEAARIAAARAALWQGTPAKNWNGFQLKGSDRSPILLPSYRPSLDAQNTALRTYGLAPVTQGPSGNLEVVKGRTTSLATDKRLWAWSSEAQAAFHMVDLRDRFHARFTGTSIVRFTDPRSSNVVDAQSFISATQQALFDWEAQGNYDGAALLSSAVAASPDGNNPFKMNVDWTESPVLDLDQVSFVGHFASPPR